MSPIPLGSTVATTPIPGDVAGIDAEIASLTTASASTNQSAKARVDRLEALWKAKTATLEAAPAARSDGPAEGFEPPTSGTHYQFEKSLLGIEPPNPEAMGSLKTSLANVGMPVPIANNAFAHVAELQSSGVYATDEAYYGAVQGAKLSLHKTLGMEGAKATIADALAWMEKAVKADPSLSSAAEYALASPQAILAAAQMHRHGKR